MLRFLRAHKDSGEVVFINSNHVNTVFKHDSSCYINGVLIKESIDNTINALIKAGDAVVISIKE